MRKAVVASIALGTLALTLISCGSSGPAIATAVVQTVESKSPAPTYTPYPTLSPYPTYTPYPTAPATAISPPDPTETPWSQSDLEKVLIQTGDLPGDLEPSQISNAPLSLKSEAMFDAIDNTHPVNLFLNQQIFYPDPGREWGFVSVYLFDDPETAAEALETGKIVLNQDGYSTRFLHNDVGEDDAYSSSQLLFTRCSALIHIWLTESQSGVFGGFVNYPPSTESTFAYGSRLDQRLLPFVCK